MGQTSQIQLGVIPGVFGIKGWLKALSYCRPIEQILRYATWQLHTNDNKKAYSLEQGNQHGTTIIVKLAGIDTRAQAETLIHAEIWVLAAELPELPPNEYYWYQLVGLNVVTMDGQVLGKIKRLIETGANDVLVVKDDSGSQEILIPYVKKDVVKNVDLDQKLMSVDWADEF